ncbi:hypothetical protein AB0I60_19370 [Actinosynnema sp. NPDC050436]|uniref:hypothetical protein n=1 Tax=Actinosynnema sp. NPDC050436 TaxID=3155659 RepID=UPI0033D392DA
MVGKWKKTAAALAIGVVTLPVTTVPAIAGAPGTDPTVQSCYGSAKSYTAIGDVSADWAEWPDYGYATTTSACADINVKTNYSRYVRVCFATTSTCNEWKPAYAGQWTVVASDVLDNTKFWLRFQGHNNSTGQVAC